MKRKIVWLVLLAAVLTGCNQGESKQVETNKEINVSQAETSNESKEETSNENELSQENITDKRIIAASKTVAEYLSLFDQKIVGVAKQENLPDMYADVEQVGSPRKLNLEVISSLKPDYVIANESSKDDLESSLKSQGIEGIYIDSSSYQSVFDNINKIGHLLGQDEKSKNITEEMLNKEAEILDQAKALKGKSVLMIFGNGDNFQLMTQNTYLGNLAEKLGMVNIGKDQAGDKKYLPYSLEEIVNKNPDYILTLAHGNKEQAKAIFASEFEKDLWKNLDAVKENRLIHLDDTSFPVTGNIHVMDTLKELVDLLKAN